MEGVESGNDGVETRCGGETRTSPSTGLGIAWRNPSSRNRTKELNCEVSVLATGSSRDSGSLRGAGEPPSRGLFGLLKLARRIIPNRGELDLVTLETPTSQTLLDCKEKGPGMGRSQ